MTRAMLLGELLPELEDLSADLAVTGVKLVKDQFEQRGLPHAVAADEAHVGAHRNAHGRVVKKPAAPGVECQVIDLQHGERGGLSEAGP